MTREKSRRSFIEVTEAGLNFKAVQREREKLASNYSCDLVNVDAN